MQTVNQTALTVSYIIQQSWPSYNLLA